MGASFPREVERESYRAPLTLLAVAVVTAALAMGALAVSGVEDLVALARARARRGLDEAALEARTRIQDRHVSPEVSPRAAAESAALVLRDPALAERLRQEGVVRATVVDARARPVGAPIRFAPAPPDAVLEERTLPLDDRERALGSLRLELVTPDRAIDAARAGALGRCALASGLALVLVGGASLGAARLVRRERDRARATRARARLARLGLLAGGLGRELEHSLQGVRESLLVLRERLPEDLPHLADEVCPGGLCDGATNHVARAEAIVRDFVSGARPEPAPPRVADVASLVRDWARALEAELGAHGIGLLLEGTNAPASAVVDPSGLKRIFWSLVRNARDAAPAGSLVRVSLLREDGRVRIRVADGGPGIDAGRREEVFEPLLSTKPSGTGLGLAVSRRLAEAMGARLALVGGPPGAVFEVSLRSAPLTIPFDVAATPPPYGWQEAA